MILETILGLCLIQATLNNSDYIEDNFHRFDRIVIAAKRTRHVVHSHYCHCYPNGCHDQGTTTINVVPRRETRVSIDFDTFQ